MEKQKEVGFSGFTLKLVALLFMILDHVHSYLGVLPQWVSLLPRFVAPLFVYFLVEGFHHTHNRKAYVVRLYIAAAVMFAGNILINLLFHNVDYMTGEVTIFSLIDGNNILITLALFFSIMIFLNRIQESSGGQKVLSIIAVVCLCLVSCACEGGLYLLPILFLCYFGYGKNKVIVTGILLWSALCFAKAMMSYLSGGSGTGLYGTLCYDNEWMMALVIVPILLYNGKRGNHSAFAKWMFYIVYPLHLWILMILRFVLA